MLYCTLHHLYGGLYKHAMSTQCEKVQWKAAPCNMKRLFLYQYRIKKISAMSTISFS